MHKQAKPKSKARRAARRAQYLTVRGKRVKVTARGARMLRAVTRALKGVDIPPP